MPAGWEIVNNGLVKRRVPSAAPAPPPEINAPLSAPSPKLAAVSDVGGLRTAWRWAFLVAAVFAIYAPAFDGEFVWDDHGIYISHNGLLRESDGIYRFWFTNDPVDYYPLTYTTFWFEWQAVETDTRLYHIDNVLLHLGAAFVLYALLKRLDAPYPWFVCLLFAVHPIQLESVAWISQRKSLLGALFGFAAAYDYLGARQKLSRAARWRGPFWFFLSLSGKPVLIALPPLLAGYEWLSGERNWRIIAHRTAPYFGLSLIFGIVGVAYQQKLIGGVDVRGQNLAERLASLGWAAWFYVGQTLRIDAMNFVYPRWKVDALNIFSWLPDAAALVVLWATWNWRRRLGLLPFAAWTTYLVTMLPSLGLADVFYWRYSYVGDHYVYQSLPALLVVLSWLGRTIIAHRPQTYVPIVSLGIGFIAASGFFSWQRAHLYQKEEDIWVDALSQNPQAFLALSNLGGIRGIQGRSDDALRLLDQALELDPRFYEPHARKGDIFTELKKWQQALESYRRASDLAPALSDEWFQAKLGEGEALFHLNHTAESETLLSQIESMLASTGGANVQVAAMSCRARVYLWYLAGVRADANRQTELLAQIERATTAAPEARREAAPAWFEVGEFARALELWKSLLHDDSNDPKYRVHSNLGITLMMLGSTDEALVHFREAAAMAPENARMHANLALAYTMTKRYPEAVDEYRRVQEIEPDDVASKRDLAWILAVSPLAGPQTAAEALRLAQDCVALTQGIHPAALDALAAALALGGKFDEAAVTAERAVEAGAKIGAPQEAQQARLERAALYRQRSVYREP